MHKESWLYRGCFLTHRRLFQQWVREGAWGERIKSGEPASSATTITEALSICSVETGLVASEVDVGKHVNEAYRG